MSKALGAVFRDAVMRLGAAGIDTAPLDARILVAEALGVDEAHIIGHPERILNVPEQAAIDSLIARRAAREPLAHIVGVKEFWSLPFHVGPDVLTPRPDTETLIETVLDARPDRGRPYRILDLGLGSGCILLTLLSEFPNAVGFGVDISAAALAIARQNAVRHALTNRAFFIRGSWCDALCGTFDIIVSNPPYIPDADIDALEPEVAAFEPTGALMGGMDGLDMYRILARTMGGLLSPGAMAAFEVGENQSADVRDLLRQAGFNNISLHQDLAGIQRIVCVENL